MSQKPYRQQMDELRIPEDKANETLKRMLAENRRLNEKAAKKQARSPFLRRLPAVVLAAAACLVAVWIGVRSLQPARRYTSVQFASLPSVLPLDEPSTYFQHYLDHENALFSGWQIAEAGSEPHERLLSLDRDNTRLSASVTDYEPPLLTYLKSAAQPDENRVYYAQDPDTHTRYAVFENDGLYITLFSDTASDADFADAVRQITGK